MFFSASGTQDWEIISNESSRGTWQKAAESLTFVFVGLRSTLPILLASMTTVWLFVVGLGMLLALGTWCAIRLRAEYRTRNEPTLLTVAIVWTMYGIHFILTLVAAANSTWLFPLPRLLSVVGGILFLTVGASIYAAAVVAFRSMSRLSGLNSSRLITVGIYRWSRNPQYLGWTLFLIGIALLRTSGMVLLLAALFWISYRMYLPSEERLLERIYGEEYRIYRSQTHRYFGPVRQR